MKRFKLFGDVGATLISLFGSLVGSLVLLLGGATGCNKPSAEDCQKAILKMEQLLGTETTKAADLQGEIRRCQGGSTREAVDCAVKANTLEELKACAFMSKKKSE